MDNVTGDFSCGYCGWWGSCEDCDLELEDENEPEGDGLLLCPKCGQDRVGSITPEDFRPGNILHGKTWHGQIIN